MTRPTTGNARIRLPGIILGVGLGGFVDGILLSGYLFAWSIAGPDPGPHRPRVPVRLVALGVAVAAHAAIAQLLYANVLVDVPATGPELRAGASLMYYLGDLAEILLALALLVTWRPDRAARRPVPRPAPLRA